MKGDRDNVMDRVGSRRIGNDKRHRSSEIMLAWQGGGESKGDTIPTWGVEVKIVTSINAGLHQEFHQLRIKNTKGYWR